ncbi:hypothetical protein [Synechococcus elongatus]|uniref:Uncharacterized protein n=1 Tax=Synechococcus elongatus (strain ATCC 33912 / PCC 7942 / FACHB-805) TaxID=1140 RepID=Q31PC3_SYNE7|nr:hypothetical protein [Synechococcus elongatus]AJD58904.1 hypothetical protein M744_11345 [Synechococcus elongatus UTEX 2973]UOW70874.1 hypothetical protein PCC7943_1117 [Synechococcus elongatus PCC 7943]UOW73595.1 hypothetical protein PCC6311_1117 [Synechococcus elongatus PCC 6311]ABB57096.1 hypothetical protein Synpcc7942_1066 [Synechococcus elongatus PCC 7942 = FACHB-805]UOW76315.1 hypothetical protein PCC6301pg_1117 [Synechococcus elongatus PCC 6301]
MRLAPKVITSLFYPQRSQFSRSVLSEIFLVAGGWGSRVPQCVGVGVRNHPHKTGCSPLFRSLPAAAVIPTSDPNNPQYCDRP